jgi:hypothetical protein
VLIVSVFDGQNYLVKDPILIQVIFFMLKENIRETPLVLTLSLMRMIARRMLIHTESQPAVLDNLLIGTRHCTESGYLCYRKVYSSNLEIYTIVSIN